MDLFKVEDWNCGFIFDLYKPKATDFVLKVSLWNSSTLNMYSTWMFEK